MRASTLHPAFLSLSLVLVAGCGGGGGGGRPSLSDLAQEAYAKASDTGAGDEFGSSVAVSGDTMVVGAPSEDFFAVPISFIDSGAAYVFVRTGATWTEQAYLKASNTATGDGFGASVAISGDTIVVGADLEDSNATGVNGNESDNSAADSGAAYVFVRAGTTWTQQAYLKASNTDGDDFFGSVVSISGDAIVIGASGEDSGATGVNGDEADDSAGSAGAAYGFVRHGATWAQQGYLKASNSEPGDIFGSALSISGGTIVVGSRYEASASTGVNGDEADNSATFSGAVYVFR